MPYYTTDPKRDHILDNHPYVESCSSELFQGSQAIISHSLGVRVDFTSLELFGDRCFRFGVVRARVADPMLPATSFLCASESRLEVVPLYIWSCMACDAHGTTARNNTLPARAMIILLGPYDLKPYKRVMT